MNNFRDRVSNLLAGIGRLEEVFKALDENNGVEGVFLILRYIRTVPQLALLGNTEIKLKSKSDEIRRAGNVAFENKKYIDALMHYQLALMFAPHNSSCLAQAYFNRSTLFMKLMKFEECLRDIELCFKLPYATELKHKLKALKNNCITAMSQNKELISVDNKTFEKYFNLPGKTHKTISCASDSLEIRYGKVVAAKDIYPGEVVSVETAYASSNCSEASVISCHHCHKCSNSLIPCKSCCFVMFCSVECRKVSWDSFHSLECNLMNICPTYCNSGKQFRISVQAVLKAVIESNGWKKLIESVENVENVKGFTDTFTPYQNLCRPAIYDKIKRLGRRFVTAVDAAFVLNALINTENFLLNDKCDRGRVISFLAKQLMLHCENDLLEISNVKCKDDVTQVKINDYGLFPFTGMVEHSCNPNVASFGLGNKITLVATDIIPKGRTLQLSYWKDFISEPMPTRKRWLYYLYGMICKCEACEENWAPASDVGGKNKPLIKMQRRNMWDGSTLGIDADDDNSVMKHFQHACNGLELCHGMPKSVQKDFFIRSFYKCYNIFQAKLTQY